jgi:cystathionine gamma-synthase
MPRFETLAVHAGGTRDATGAIAPPLYLSTIYEHGPGGEGIHDDLYVRYGNPTQRRLEEALATLDGGAAALVFASGIAAGTAYLQSLPPGSHVVFAADLFYGFRALVPTFLPRWGITWSEVDIADMEAVRAAVRAETRLIWVDTPSNPLMIVADIPSVAAIAHTAGARLLVDATFATPALVQPLVQGADVVLHSTTKYLGGHTDVMGGALVFAEEDDTFRRVTAIRTHLGGVASPFASWLVLRGVRTLAARMRVHSSNAAAVAHALERHPAVTRVRYPGFGGMMSFEVAGGRERAIAVASRVRLFTNAGSLGGPESLIQHSVSIQHPADRIPDTLLRLSIGLEHPDDLIADLEHALSP